MGPQSEVLPAEVAKSLAEIESVGALAIVDGATAKCELDAGLTARGVIFSDLHTAARQHPELVQRYFGAAVATDENKFSALNYALWNSGSFVYVPRNVVIEQPLQTVISQSAGKLAGMHHTVVVTEEGASVTLVEDFIGADGGMTNSVVELLPGANSQVHYLHLQNLADTAWNFSTQRMLIDARQPAALLHRLVGQPAEQKLDQHGIEWSGQPRRAAGFVLPWRPATSGSSHKSTPQDTECHQRPAVQGRAEGSGAVGVPGLRQGLSAGAEDQRLPGQPQPDAEQAGPPDSIPGLEIEADDVRCTHGATAGQIPDEYVFYLMARGIDRGNAERMIVQGFLEEVIDRIPVEGVRSKLETEIARKLGL